MSMSREEIAALVERTEKAEADVKRLGSSNALAAEIERLRIALSVAEKERDENEGVFKVWRKRCEVAERERDEAIRECSVAVVDRNELFCKAERGRDEAQATFVKASNHASACLAEAIMECDKTRATMHECERERDAALAQRNRAWELLRTAPIGGGDAEIIAFVDARRKLLNGT